MTELQSFEVGFKKKCKCKTPCIKETRKIKLIFKMQTATVSNSLQRKKFRWSKFYLIGNYRAKHAKTSKVVSLASRCFVLIV